MLSELEQQKLLFNQAEKEKLEYQKLIEQLEAKVCIVKCTLISR